MRSQRQRWQTRASGRRCTGEAMAIEATLLNTFVNTFLLVYATLFPIVDPLGGAPLFLGLTEEYTQAERARMSRQVAINSFLLLLGSLFIGSYVLGFFGISLPVVRIA